MYKFAIISLHVLDWQRAKKFYNEILGMPVAAFLGDEVGWMEFGEKNGVHLAINLWENPATFPSRGGGGVPIFEVPDAYAAVAELRAKGVRCENVEAIPGMVTYANFYDPDGNRLQVAGPPPQD